MKLIIVENLIINFNNVTFMNIDVLKDNVLGIRVFYNCPNKEGGMQSSLFSCSAEEYNRIICFLENKNEICLKL